MSHACTEKGLRGRAHEFEIGIKENNIIGIRNNQIDSNETEELTHCQYNLLMHFIKIK